MFFRAPGGELQMVLDRDEVPSEPEVARLMRQILDGLNYLHTINVAHLDIKVRTTILFFGICFNNNNNLPAPISFLYPLIIIRRSL